MSNVDINIPAKCYAYMTQGSNENFLQMFLMLAAEILGLNVFYSEPKKWVEIG
ncbi:hypothetical protein [Thermoanaerobacter kivui]|nr:hypothetical protein [Thermoanaerobacter kivui]